MNQASLNTIAEVVGYSNLYKRLQQAMDEVPRDTLLAVLVARLGCMVDVDGSYGYRAGDVVLQQVVERLRAALRESDILGLVGREEVVCILPALQSQGHLTLAAHKILRCLEQPLRSAGHDVYLGANLGIALYTDNAPDAEKLLQQAHLAMQGAKLRRQGFAVYSNDVPRYGPLPLELQAELQEAIENNELLLYYQPQLELKTGHLTSCEALLRWNHKERGFVAPDKMVQLAEKTGLISALTTWVINAALRECAKFREVGLNMAVSINVSAENLRETELPDYLSHAMELWKITPDRFILELTETAMMEDRPALVDTLLRLKELGVALSMDDFGAGYSSMARLSRLPLDEVKLDMSFIRNMLKTQRDEKVVHSMIELAHNLGMRVVAEGVEDRQTLACLKTLGCDLIQGYHISPPVPANKFERVIQEFQSKADGSS
jgi:diguanylate cyclase (GGDEF)-like protein